MVAKKKNAPEGEIPKPKAGGWAKSPAIQTEEPEFDPSRVAGILSGKSGEQLAEGGAADEAVAETHAVEGWEAPFRDGYTDEQPAPAPESAPEPAPKSSKGKPKTQPATKPGNTNAELVAIVERVERLLEESQAIRDDVKEVLGEAKGAGFDTATIRRVIAYRAKDPDKVAEQESLFDTYFHAIGGRR